MLPLVKTAHRRVMYPYHLKAYLDIFQNEPATPLRPSSSILVHIYLSLTEYPGDKLMKMQKALLSLCLSSARQRHIVWMANSVSDPQIAHTKFI